MLEFLALASSSAGCSYIVTNGKSAPLLIDAGIRYKLIQQALNFQVTRLAGCLVSHSHGDHCMAAKDLMRAGVDCFASQETWKALNISSHRAKSLEVQTPKLIGDWTVQAFDAIHDAPGTFGFVVASPCGGKLLYLTDSAYSRFRFAGLTHIAIECNFSKEIIRQNTRSGEISGDRFSRTTQTHMSLDRLIDMLRANDLSEVEEITLLHLSDANSDEAEFKDAVQRATGKVVRIAPKTFRGAL